MKQNNYPLSRTLRNRIQGLVGERVALNYVLEQLDTETGDEVIIVTNRSEKSQFKNERNGAVFHIINKTAFEFFQHELVNYYLRIGCKGVDLANAKFEAKNIFGKYMSKTKDEILSELKIQFENYLKYKDENLPRLDYSYKDEKNENERCAIDESLLTKNKENECNVLKALGSLSHEELAKVLTIVDINRENFIKKVQEQKSMGKLVAYSPSAFLIKPESIIICMQLFNLPTLAIRIESRYEERNLLKTFSKYVNAKYAELEILSSVFKGVVETRVKIDLMVVHLSDIKTLKKIIIVECKTNDSVLSKNQKDFADYVSQLKSDKVQYKKINIDYQAPKNLLITEDYV
jgi:hypothetical protein